MECLEISYISFSLGYSDSILLETNEELLGIDLSVSIVGVEESEGSAKTSDAGSTSGGKLLLKSVENYRLG